MAKGADAIGPEGSNSSDAEQIRAHIERTRAEMGETIDELQARLAPERIKEQVKEQVKTRARDAYASAKDAVKRATIRRAERVMNSVGETVEGVRRGAKEGGTSLLDNIRENPLPYALIGAGVGILAMRKRRSRDITYSGIEREHGARYYEAESAAGVESESSTLERARETTASKAREWREGAAEMAERTRERAERMGEQARYRAQRARSGMQDMLERNPLAVGAAVMAAGAAVGLALPPTRMEREYMGEAREQLMDKAGTAARETVEKVKRVAGEAGRTAQEEARNQGLTGAS